MTAREFQQFFYNTLLNRILHDHRLFIVNYSELSCSKGASHYPTDVLAKLTALSTWYRGYEEHEVYETVNKRKIYEPRAFGKMKDQWLGQLRNCLLTLVDQT